MTSDEAATFPRPFVPLAELPGYETRDGDRAPSGPVRILTPDPKFIAKQRAVFDARRRQGMNLIVQGDDRRIVKIAPDGAETDVTAELDCEVASARARSRPPSNTLSHRVPDP